MWMSSRESNWRPLLLETGDAIFTIFSHSSSQFWDNTRTHVCVYTPSWDINFDYVCISYQQEFCNILMQSFREGFDVDVVESSYHGGVSKSSLGELLGPQQLCLEAGSKDTSVRLFQNTMEGFPKHQVCVLNAQHVLRGRMEQTVPISY